MNSLDKGDKKLIFIKRNANHTIQFSILIFWPHPKGNLWKKEYLIECHSHAWIFKKNNSQRFKIHSRFRIYKTFYLILGLFLERKLKKFSFLEMNSIFGSIVIILTIAGSVVKQFIYYWKLYRNIKIFSRICLKTKKFYNLYWDLDNFLKRNFELFTTWIRRLFCN